MNPRFSTLRRLVCAVLCGSGIVAQAQTAAPKPAPPISQSDKEKAAAIEAPRILLPDSPAGKVLVPSTPPPVQKLPDVRPAPSVPSLNAPRENMPPPTPGGAPRLTPPPLPPVIGEPSVPKSPPSAPAPPVPPQLPPQMTKDEALNAVTKSRTDAVEARSIPLPADKIPITSSTSSSGQFRVHGPDLQLRSRMSSHLDEIATELRTALHDGDPHVIPINVRLTQGEEAIKATSAGSPPVAIGITEVDGGGIHLQLDIHDVPALSLAAIRRETVRLLLAERIVRNHAKIIQPENRLLLPDWIYTGVMQALDFRASARPSTMFAAIFRSGKIYGIEEIIEASPTQMDTLSRAIYDTSCGALVMALIDQPDGGSRFNKFLNSLNAGPRTERELLNASFPGFAASASSLNKWWSLQLATLAKRSLTDPLTGDESLLALEKAITISYPAKPEDVPKDIPKRPFVVPDPLFTPPSSTAPKKPHPDDLAAVAGVLVQTPSASEIAEKTSKSTSTAKKKDEDTTEAKKDGSPWLRYLTFGLLGNKKDGEEPADKDKPKEKETTKEDKPAPEVAAAEMPPEAKEKPAKEQEAPAAESKPGLFSRLMSRSNLEAAEERQKAADELAKAREEKAAKDAEAKAKAAKEAEAKAKAAAEKEAADKAKADAKPKTSEKPKAAEKTGKDEPKDDKPSIYNPFNWFRGSKKAPEESKDTPKAESKAKAAKEEPAPKKKDEKAAEAKKQTSLADLLPSPLAILGVTFHPLAEFWEFVLPSLSPRHAFLDFLKRKKPADDAKAKAAEPEAPKPVAPPAPAKKKEPKPASTTPPKTTNPNAKPAARPVQPADGSRRTTNPNAKPLIIPKPPPASNSTGSTGEGLSTLPPGMVLVEFHIEDYKHILKHPDRVQILEHNAATLRALEPRVSVIMRPVVLGYLDVVLALQDGKTKDLDKRLAVLRGLAIATMQKTKAVRDYVDWYEANETEKLSGKFDDFLDLPNIIQKELPPREDPIARYLDAIDKEFSK